MQQRALRLAVRKHCDTAHDGLDGIRINNALLDARNEEGRFAALEVVVEVDQEREK
jgi:hypothetical protein